jgi:CDP-paratose 2-epimerase
MTVLITGGAGFIGTNLADRLLRDGSRVRILDSLARAGVEENLRWLQTQHGNRLQVIIGDIRDADTVRRAAKGAAQVFHFAAQVAVTTSLTDPVEDFEVNARGTLNLLEALRSHATPPPLLYTSTNKVYGALDDIPLRHRNRRYIPVDDAVARSGIGEGRPLDFHSPYGCSKGAADQYVLDYARTYGLPAMVFRMSCIYGPHQFGTEDQGWVAHFLIQTSKGLPVTLYGDGRQVRDVLFIEDLVDAFLKAQEWMPVVSGHAFNIGGGTANTVSLVELLELIGELQGRPPEVRHAAWRPADQRFYVSDTARFEKLTGWRATVGVREGVQRLAEWLTGAGRLGAARKIAGAYP